jgi:excisionase family DNA binding protein
MVAMKSEMTELKELAWQSRTSPAMTVREAAHYLNCTRAYIFHLINAGVLPFQKMGKHFVVPRAAVEKLLRSRWNQNDR